MYKYYIEQGIDDMENLLSKVSGQSSFQMCMFCPFMLLLITFSATLGCTTAQAPAEPPKAFQLNEDVLYRANSSIHGMDTQLVLTDQAIYLLYKGKYAYMNPAYTCAYEDFIRYPVQKDGKVVVTCKKKREIEIYYLQVSNSIDGERVITTINNMLKNNIAVKEVGIHEQRIDSIAIGISTPGICVSNEQFIRGADYEDINPLLLTTHPQAAPYIIADPVSLIGASLGMAIDDATNKWKEKKRRKERRIKLEKLTEFSVVLANTADTLLMNNVSFISYPCNAIVEDQYEGYMLLADSVRLVLEVDAETFSSNLTYFTKAEKKEDTEISISVLYIIIDTESGTPIYHNKIKYVHTNPSVRSTTASDNAYKEKLLRNAYREISELIVDDIIGIKQITE